MFAAYGWVIVRSSLDSLRALPEAGDASHLLAEELADDSVANSDERLFDRIERFLASHEPPDLDWHFRRHMNNEDGILMFSSSRNHRGCNPTAVEVLRWIAEQGPDSYGLVYVHDDEDCGESGRMRGRTGNDHRNEFRVWRLRLGRIDELDDPFLSPIGPDLDPEWAP